MLKKYLQSAIPMAKEAVELLRVNFRHLKFGQIHEKGPRDMVTDLDKAIERNYVASLKREFPDHGILGEEGTSEHQDREYVWVIDPLDGTKNYINGVPFFATTLCLLHNQEPVLGIIYEPITDDLYTAIKGEGALCNGLKIHVSSIREPAESTVLYCHGRRIEDIDETYRYIPALKKEYRDVARLRCAGCEMTMVASGRAEVYAMNALPIWDLAIGALLVREAGGKATNFKGEEWKTSDNNIIASNGTVLHEKILNVINSA